MEDQPANKILYINIYFERNYDNHKTGGGGNESFPRNFGGKNLIRYFYRVFCFTDINASCYKFFNFFFFDSYRVMLCVLHRAPLRIALS